MKDRLYFNTFKIQNVNLFKSSYKYLQLHKYTLINLYTDSVRLNHLPHEILQIRKLRKYISQVTWNLGRNRI